MLHSLTTVAYLLCSWLVYGGMYVSSCHHWNMKYYILQATLWQLDVHFLKSILKTSKPLWRQLPIVLHQTSSFLKVPYSTLWLWCSRYWKTSINNSTLLLYILGTIKWYYMLLGQDTGKVQYVIMVTTVSAHCYKQYSTDKNTTCIAIPKTLLTSPHLNWIYW